MKPDQERVKALLTDTVTLLCKNGLHYQKELKVQGLLGITTDEDEVFLVHINEKFGGMLGSLGISISSPDNDTVSQIAKNTAVLAQASNRDKPPKKDKVIDLTDRREPAISPRKSPDKIRKRRRFSEESSSPVVSSSPVASPPPASSHHQQTRHVPPPVLETSAAEYYEEPSSAHTFSEGTSVDMSPEESQNCAQPTVKIKQERDVIMIDKKPTREEIASLAAATATSHIPNRTEIDKNAMQQTYGSLGLSLEEIQGGFPHFEALDNSLSGDMKPHPAKRRASEPHSLADPAVDMPTDIGPGLGLGGPFITGMVQNVRSHLPTSDTSAGSWDNSALGALPDDQIIIDDAPGCSSWNSSQLSAATASHHSTGHSADTSDTRMDAVEFVTTKFGKPAATYRGYRYRHRRTGGNGNKYWVCTHYKRKCKSTLTTNGAGAFVKWSGEHGHPPDVAQCDVSKAISNMRTLSPGFGNYLVGNTGFSCPVEYF